MNSIRTQRFIAILLIISPWIYVPMVFKEIAFLFLAVLLYLSTIDLRKKHKVESVQQEAIVNQNLA